MLRHQVAHRRLFVTALLLQGSSRRLTQLTCTRHIESSEFDRSGGKNGIRRELAGYGTAELPDPATSDEVAGVLMTNDRIAAKHALVRVLAAPRPQLFMSQLYSTGLMPASATVPGTVRILFAISKIEKILNGERGAPYRIKF